MNINDCKVKQTQKKRTSNKQYNIGGTNSEEKDFKQTVYCRWNKPGRKGLQTNSILQVEQTQKKRTSNKQYTVGGTNSEEKDFKPTVSVQRRGWRMTTAKKDPRQ